MGRAGGQGRVLDCSAEAGGRGPEGRGESQGSVSHLNRGRLASQFVDFHELAEARQNDRICGPGPTSQRQRKPELHDGRMVVTAEHLLAVLATSGGD